jgi:hypothetical protein
MRCKPRIIACVGAVWIAALAACGDDPAAPPPDQPPPPNGDLTPPETVTDLSLSFDATSREARLAWTAPRDDELHDRVARYEIRYSYTFPLDWWTALPVSDSPSPSVGGTPQAHVIAGVIRDRDLYAAILSVDEAGLRSPVSSVAHVRLPGYLFDATCVDAITGAPVAGLDVVVTERYVHTVVTGVDGRVVLDDLRRGAVGVRVDRGVAAPSYFGLEEWFDLDADRARVYSMIEFVPADNAPYASVFEVLMAGVISPDRILKKWRTLPVPWYAPAFVNAYGLDYYDLATRAAARWNEATGLALFVPAGSSPATGVTMAFLPPVSMGGQNGVTQYDNDAQGYPRLDSIRIVDTFVDEQKLYNIMLHEFGHTVRLGHLDGPAFIMYAGQPLPNDISNDEVRAVQLMHALPNEIDLRVYDMTPPQ